uniref:Uncharacterized protein n=1 Tax=Candidatus Kentrum sp. SD TaxID=2126332 RepID=A0A451BQJ4_9GAMM|nr:MAG: hypothetical protein BECKSD772D_GA0070982_11277 [Candidatus Kentron sp. SD]
MPTRERQAGDPPRVPRIFNEVSECPVASLANRFTEEIKTDPDPSGARFFLLLPARARRAGTGNRPRAPVTPTKYRARQRPLMMAS